MKALKKSGVADKKSTGDKLLSKRKLIKRKLPAAEDLFSAVALYHAPSDEEGPDIIKESVEPLPSKDKDTNIPRIADKDIVDRPDQENTDTEGLSAETPIESRRSGIFAEKHPTSSVSEDEAQANRPQQQESAPKSPDFSRQKALSETIPEYSIKPSSDLTTSRDSSLTAEVLSLSQKSEPDVFLQKLDHSLKNVIENENFDIKLEKVVTQMVKRKMAQKNVGRKLANVFEECILKGVKDFKGN